MWFLQDKWRNLVRSSSAQKFKSKEVNHLFIEFSLIFYGISSCVIELNSCDEVFTQTFSFVEIHMKIDMMPEFIDNLMVLQAEQMQQQASRSLPSYVLCRVHELAKIHPYPRVRSSKESLAGQVNSLILPTGKKGGLRRNVRRKRCTWTSVLMNLFCIDKVYRTSPTLVICFGENKTQVMFDLEELGSRNYPWSHHI